tara:strand:- start:1257 stop:1487 length:231 start_codon:yes stop_codon:yes gene_type:complete
MTKKIENFILKNLNIKNKKIKIKKNLSLLNQNFDSLEFLKLIFKLEKKFKLTIKSKEYEKLNTVENIIRYVKKNEK